MKMAKAKKKKMILLSKKKKMARVLRMRRGGKGESGEGE